jgi:predicted nucleotidyltransferase
MKPEQRKPWVPTREDIEAVARDIADKFRPERIILFGSYAYGTPTDDSDVDLLVVMDTDEDPISIAGRILSQAMPGCLLDVIVRTPDELQRRVERTH